jgi:tyrosine-protein kinase Etk/Wzc
MLTILNSFRLLPSESEIIKAVQAPILTVKTRPISLSLSVLFDLLWRRRVFILIGSLGTAILLFCLSLLISNTFKATALVMPPDSSSSSAMSMLGSSAAGLPSGALAALNIKNPADRYVALMLSPLVEDAVIDRFDLTTLYHARYRSLVRKTLEANTQILADAKSGIISISFVDKSPQRAADVTNGIVQAFEKFSSQLALTDASRRRLFFQRQVAETKDALTRAEDTLKGTSSKTGVLEPEGSARAMIGYEAQLHAEIATKTVALHGMKVYQSDENPQVQIATRELESLRQEAASLDAKNGSAYSKTAQSSASLDYLRAMRDVKTNETIYQLLLKNLEIAQLDEAREGNVIQMVSPATVPDIKNGPHRSFFIIGGLFLGLIGSSIWVLLDWAKVWVAANKVQPVA